MTSYLKSLCACTTALIFLAGCAESQFPEASGKGTISAVHAISTAAEVTFLIEERALGAMSYKGSVAAQPFDNINYSFNFDARIAGQPGLTRIATETRDIAADTDYVFAVTGTASDASVVVWESEDRQWGESETVAEISAGHLAANSGPIDVYFEAPGSTPVTGGARGTISFGEKLPAFDVENGSWQVILTVAGDPSAILFRSNAANYNERTSSLLTIQDPDPSITSNLSVRRITEGSSASELGDVNFPPTRRFFNAARGSGNVDVWLNNNFDTPIASDLAYATVSGDVPVPSTDSTYTFTAAGNPGAVLLETESKTPLNTRSTSFLTGETSALEVAAFIDDRRPVSGFGKIRISQMSSRFATVDIYVLEAGTNIAEAAPTLQLGSGTNSEYLHFPEGGYELTVTVAGGKTVLVGPRATALPSGTPVEMAIIDTVDPNALDLVSF